MEKKKNNPKGIVKVNKKETSHVDPLHACNIITQVTNHKPLIIIKLTSFRAKQLCLMGLNSHKECKKRKKKSHISDRNKCDMSQQSAHIAHTIISNLQQPLVWCPNYPPPQKMKLTKRNLYKKDFIIVRML